MVEPVSMIMGIIGIGAGIAIGWLIAKNQFSTDLVRSEERMRAQEEAMETSKEMLNLQMSKVAKDVASQNSEDFLRLAEERLGKVQSESNMDLEARKKEVENLIKPLRDEMEKLAKSNVEMEKDRAGAYEGIKRQLKDLGDQTEKLGIRATALSTALTTSSQARGDWGEIKLRRLFEMAGLSEHVDFFEQETIEGGGRPDFIVRLPEEGILPIDSKATGAAFLRAAELDPGPEQEALLSDHAVAMKNRIKELSSKRYQENVDGDFDHVIMFIPSEATAAAAFTTDPDLLSYAMSKGVLIATPVTMLGLLRTVALYWQQHALAEGAREIYDVSREMYKRTIVLADHLMRVGGHLEKASKSYNEAMSSYESRVLPQGRRLDELKVSETLTKSLPEPKEIETFPHRINSTEEE